MERVPEVAAAEQISYQPRAQGAGTAVASGFASRSRPLALSI